MKRTFKIIVLLISIAFMCAGQFAGAVEKNKKYHESWAVSGVETLAISNKFGEIKIKNGGGSQITIDVLVTVEAANENRADELLDKIDVDFSKSGNTVRAVTSMSNNFKSQRRFSIDYVVNVPSDKNLQIENKYGNTIVGKLNAEGKFDIQYGNLTASELTAPAGKNINIMLAYGKASVEKANDLYVEIKYSGMTLGEISDLRLDSKYSSLDIEKGKDLKIDSKYDKFDFESVKSLEATTKYSHIRIEELAKSLRIDAGYGGIKVDEVAPGFELIDITNSYGQISLGLNGAAYTVEARCEYCGINFPEDNFKGDRIKDNNTMEIKGKVGSGGVGAIKISSRYGEIKLED